MRADLIATLGRDRAAERIRWLSRRAARAWRRIADPDDDAPLNHDAYLKLFALARPTLPAELLLVDEAQDLAPVMLTLLDDAAPRRLLVGDPAQRIYAWRGAVDAMAASGLPETRLTRSFRFGPEIAAVARRILTVIDRRPRLSGSGAAGSVRTVPEAAQPPCTVLCRTNAGVLEAALAFGEGGVHVVGGVAETVRLLRAAYALWADRGRSRPPAGRRNGRGRAQVPCGTDGPAHPELAGLNTWDALVEAAERRRGALSMLRTRVEAYGHDTPALCRALERAHLPREADAPVVLSTAHKAKGREWDHVTLWHDFPRVPTDAGALRAAPDREAARSELNLLYVGVTRARRTLDLARLREDLSTWLAAPTEPSTAVEAGASASLPG
ncbi:MAG: 3'-5' exonuclease [Trueperaceae bacterium]|nr:3'-5' exonuclease [Trueperaceae bacterium]